VADPNFKNVLTHLIATIKNSGKFEHVGIKEQIGTHVGQCPAVLVSITSITWEPRANTLVTGGAYGISFEVNFELYVFSMAGPEDVVKQRLDKMADLHTVLSADPQVGGMLLSLVKSTASLPDPTIDPAEGGGCYGSALITYTATANG